MSTVWSLNESKPDSAFIFFICNFRLVFVTEPHFSQNAVESCGMPQKSPPDGPGKDKKSFCLLSVFKRRSLGLRMKKISCHDRGIIPAKPCLITKLSSSGIWMSFQSWQLICPMLFLFNRIKRKVIFYNEAYSREAVLDCVRKKIICRNRRKIPAKPCWITKLSSSGIWMSFRSCQPISPTLFLFNQIKRKVISHKAYSKELGKIYVISKPQINLVLR